MADCPDFECFYEGHNRRTSRNPLVSAFYNDDRNICANIGRKLVPFGGSTRKVIVPRYYDTETEAVVDGRFTREKTGNRRLKPIIRGVPVQQTYDHFVKVRFGIAKDTGFIFNSEGSNYPQINAQSNWLFYGGFGGTFPAYNSVLFCPFYLGHVFASQTHVSSEYLLSYLAYLYDGGPEPVLPNKPTWWNDAVLNPYFNWGWDGSTYPPFKEFDIINTNNYSVGVTDDDVGVSFIKHELYDFFGPGSYSVEYNKAFIQGITDSSGSVGDKAVLVPLYIRIDSNDIKRIVLSLSLSLVFLKYNYVDSCYSCADCSGNPYTPPQGSVQIFVIDSGNWAGNKYYKGHISNTPFFRLIPTGCQDFSFDPLFSAPQVYKTALLNIILEFPIYSENNPYGDTVLGGPGFINHLRNSNIFSDVSKIEISAISAEQHSFGHHCYNSATLSEAGSFIIPLVSIPTELQSYVGNNVVALSSSVAANGVHTNYNPCTGVTYTNIITSGWVRSFVSITQGISPAGLEG